MKKFISKALAVIKTLYNWWFLLSIWFPCWANIRWCSEHRQWGSGISSNGKADVQQAVRRSHFHHPKWEEASVGNPRIWNGPSVGLLPKLWGFLFFELQFDFRKRVFEARPNFWAVAKFSICQNALIKRLNDFLFFHRVSDENDFRSPVPMLAFHLFSDGGNHFFIIRRKKSASLSMVQRARDIDMAKRSFEKI